MKDQGKCLRWAMLAVAASLAAGSAQAGETQVAMRVGKNWIRISNGNLTRDEGVKDRMLALGFTLAYRWDNGAYIEAGTAQADEIELFNFDIQKVEHHWLGGGWQFELDEKWRLTPKAGMTYSVLESDTADFIDDGPTERLHAVVPFAELALERRFRTVFSLGVYARQNFEEWGSTRNLGLSFSWHW
jgi:hypothetical protein